MAISQPEPIGYSVYVHEFSGDASVVDDVVVRVWIGGSLGWEGSAAMTAGEVWFAGVFDGGSGGFAPDGSIAHTELDDCTNTGGR